MNQGFPYGKLGGGHRCAPPPADLSGGAKKYREFGGGAQMSDGGAHAFDGGALTTTRDNSRQITTTRDSSRPLATTMYSICTFH